MIRKEKYGGTEAIKQSAILVIDILKVIDIYQWPFFVADFKRESISEIS